MRCESSTVGGGVVFGLRISYFSTSTCESLLGLLLRKLYSTIGAVQISLFESNSISFRRDISLLRFILLLYNSALNPFS